MNIEEAIKEFESTRTKKFSVQEIEKMKEVVEELSLHEFKVFPDRIADVSRTLNIHRTMIVSGEPFKESIDRGPTPYLFYPHFYALSEFTNRTNGQRIKGGVLEVFCTSEFLWVPVGRECQCGESHEEE